MVTHALNGLLGRIHESFIFYYLEQLGDGACLTDRDRRILYWNPAAELITGFSHEEMVGQHCWEGGLRPGDGGGCRLCQNRCLLARSMRGRRPARSVLTLQHKGGRGLPVELAAWPMEDRLGRTVGALQVFKDRSGAVAARERITVLERQAFLDPSTGMPNHRFLQTMLDARLGELKRHGWPFGVLCAVVDGYTSVAERYGVERGEALLRQVGAILLGHVRGYDQIGRWGGAEFMAILANVDREGLDLLARKFRMLIERAALPTPQRHRWVTLAVGGTLARRGESAADLVDRVRRLMLRSRWMGRNSVTVLK